MRKLAFLLLCAVGPVSACSSSSPRLPRTAQGEPVLDVRGELMGGGYALGSADLEALPRLTVRGADPTSGKPALWEGASVAALVSERIEVKKGADTAIVRTADRTAIPIPLTVIRQLKPVLADRVDGARLATRVLAWPTEERKGLATDPRAASWWARDVVAFEIVTWQRTFGPALALPEGAADAARRGAALFGDACVSCHRMRGVGGEKGPDLTNVASRIGANPFASMVLSHPGWAQRWGDEPGPRITLELWSYLRAMAAAGPVEPAEELTEDRAKPVANAH